MSTGIAPQAPPAATGSPATRHLGALTVVATIAIAFGLGLRLWTALGPLGVQNADEVIGGLMARDLLAGNPTVFFWGQAYGGTFEVLPLSVLMAVFGESAAIVMLPLIEVAIIGALIFAIGRRHLDRSRSLAVVGLYAVWPATAVWFGTRAMLFYNPVVIYGLSAILLVEQLGDTGRTRRHARLAGIGLAFGIGWWTSAQMLFFAAPVVYALVRHRRIRSLGEAGTLVGTTVLGAAVWIAYNIRHQGRSLTDLPSTSGSLLDHLRTQIAQGWPMVVGARRPFDERWLLPGGGWLLLTLAATAITAICIVLWRHPALRTPLAGVPLAFAVLHAFAPTGSFVGNGRYYYFVVPALAYLAGAGLSRLRPTLTAITLIAAAIVSTTTLVSMRHLQFGPTDLGSVAAALDERGISHVYADYWIGYPLAWADDQLVVTANHTDRRPDWAASVRDAHTVAYVFWLPFADDARRFDTIVTRLGDDQIESILEVGDYRIVIPTTNITPETLGEANG